MTHEATTGLLVVGHGSRREEANEDVREASRRIAELGGFPLVQAAFLEIRDPNISEGFARLIEQGANHVIVHPYFLSPGRHTRGDIPVEVSEAAAKYASVTYNITEPLTAHPLVIEACVERIRETELFTTIAPRSEPTNCYINRNPLRGYQTKPEPQTNDNRSFIAQRGTVYLVGAGPGDPGLLTVKAHDLLRSCDTVIYDYLVNPELLQLAPREAERLYVGKVGGGRQTPQAEINRLLIERARTGRRVVRLKGGDPFLFGRGAEEAEALRAAGILFEVVPGISSALAVPAYAGIPLTHRALSSSVTVLTGAHAGEGELPGSFASHASADTLVILMGVSRLREIADELIFAGRSPGTPVAVIRWGTYEAQEIVTGTLLTIADYAEAAAMRAPAVIVIGEVVALRERISWFAEQFADHLMHEETSVVAA